MTDDVLQQFETLNDAQVAKVIKLINKLAAKNEGKSPKAPQDVYTIKQKTGPSSQPKQNKQRSGKPERQEPRNGPRRGLDTKKKGRQARPQPMDIGPRENKFLAMPERNAHKDDVAIDKKLAISAPVPRRNAVQLAEVQCQGCRQWFEVNPGLIPETGFYKCNDCITR